MKMRLEVTVNFKIDLSNFPKKNYEKLYPRTIKFTELNSDVGIDYELYLKTIVFHIRF